MRLPTFIVLLSLALTATFYVLRTVILPNLSLRIAHEQRVVLGQSEPPYQYRVTKPLLAHALQVALAPLIPAGEVRHIASYTILLFFTFYGVFLALYSWLSRLGFTSPQALMGCLVLQVVMPLTVTGYYMEGDFINLLAFALGLLFIVNQRPVWLVALIGLAAFNREQIIFLLAFYWAFELSVPQPNLRRLVGTTLAAALVYAAVFFGLRFFVAVSENQYTLGLHLTNNQDNALATLLLWLVNVVGWAALAGWQVRHSGRFWQWAYALLGVGTVCVEWQLVGDRQISAGFPHSHPTGVANAHRPPADHARTGYPVSQARQPASTGRADQPSAVWVRVESAR